MAKAAKKSRYSIACTGDGAQPASPRTNAAGQPTQRFLKELIRVGKYTHPSDGMDFEIDGEWIDNAVAQFARMKEAGVKVPVPSGHSFSADDNRGWMQEMYRDGDRLYGVAELIGEDAIAAAARNDVSIYAEPNFKDANGNEYPWAIQHVALTPVPVIPGQRGFVAIAASRNGKPDKLPVFRLSTEKSTMNEHLLKLAQAMGIDVTDGMDDAAVATAMTEHYNTHKKNAEVALANEKKRADDAALALDTAKKAPQYDAPTLALHRENREGKLEKLYLSGKVTKAVCDKLSAAFIGGSDNLALSSTLDSANDARFRLILDALADLPRIRDLDASQTAANGVVPPTDRKGDEANAVDPDIAIRLSRAGVPAKAS